MSVFLRWVVLQKRMSRINDGRLSRSEIFLGGLPVAETDLFKWRHYESEIILLCVRWYLRCALSYRDLEEMMRERGLSLDHTRNPAQLRSTATMQISQR